MVDKQVARWGASPSEGIAINNWRCTQNRGACRPTNLVPKRFASNISSAKISDACNTECVELRPNRHPFDTITRKVLRIDA